ncbi:MAG: hypothetical protein E7051_09675 [Lentisphaerae bacterium]|nr:hypothetical protein [Lentisphaerota bacterium]
MKNFLVAYLDVLGGKAIIRKSPEEFFANCVELFQNFPQKIDTALGNFKNYNILRKTFSDNICIAMKIQEGKDSFASYCNFFDYVGGLQKYALVQFGWILRGGISLGDIHLSEDIVSGTPLIEAVEIEENVSIYPRIVLGQSIQKEIDIHRLNKLCKLCCLQSDHDGNFFIDYIGRTVFFIKNEKDLCRKKALADVLTRIAAWISYRIEENSSEMRILAKWLWLLSYFNDRLKDDFPHLVSFWDPCKKKISCSDLLVDEIKLLLDDK